MDTEAPIKYRRLPGRGAGGGFRAWGVRCTLWLGPDHLLSVERTNFTEDYRRYYFKDIKAIIVRRTRRWGAVTAVLLTLLLLLVGGFSIAAMKAPPFDRMLPVIFAGILSMPLLVALLVHLVRGPTCICHLRTPVQQEQLPSLNRLWKARRTLARIQAAIDAIQGPLSEEQFTEVAHLVGGYENVPAETLLARIPRV